MIIYAENIDRENSYISVYMYPYTCAHTHTLTFRDLLELL